MAKQNEPLIVGRWRITEMEMLDQDVFDEEVKAFIRFDPDGMGEFHFCYVHGFIDYRLAERDGEPAAEWSWDGNDEHHLAQGRGYQQQQSALLVQVFDLCCKRPECQEFGTQPVQAIIGRHDEGYARRPGRPGINHRPGPGEGDDACRCNDHALTEAVHIAHSFGV
ncbi:hypothetical protein LCGC14_1479670 [marine sediment metagenome]|uniref:Lipocalin-like domain-containing protein n=1 Tax=marine sediment metagenome TaxID=412755 RepID=A0A0F9LQA6_9ZZZZ